tara:strand:+ start:785 stop:1480 length:696 start_codon:yes stop_codon:yes gene_type:complete
MNSSQETAADKLLQTIIWNDYDHRQTYEYMMIIEFDADGDDESWRFPMIYIHLIMFKTLEIVTYRMELKSSHNIFKNLKYNTDLTCIECRGSKCRLKNSMVFCESCYDPDYLHYWELLLIKNEKSKIEIGKTNIRYNILFIYNYEDFTKIFDDLLYLFTSENDIWRSSNRNRYLMYNTPEETSISEKRKIELIKTMYSGIKDHYCETEQNEFKVGPHPNELPIPKTLFSNR